MLLSIGNTVIHLDKALARIREYERMKLKADFNSFNAAASSSEASNALPPPANPAGAEGTQPEPGSKDVYHHAITSYCTAQVLQHSKISFALCVRKQKVRPAMCAALRSTPSSWIARSRPS